MSNYQEEQYLDILYKLILNGDRRDGRNGGVRSLFGQQMIFDLSKGFPLLTTKKIHFKSVAIELLWFLRGDTNVKYLRDNGVTIWDEWADKNGDLGPVYGAQWRGLGAWGQYGSSAKIPGEGIDQIKNVIHSLKNDPYSRRHIVSAWNPTEIDEMALPPCHCLFQFHVSKGKLSCQLYQRSADWFLGVPFNIASYALLTHLIAREVGLEVGEFIHTFGDVHLYENHIEAAEIQYRRIPNEFPQLEITSNKGIFDIEYEDLIIHNYNPHLTIKAEVSK